uniref:uncharacterized protein LOC120331133 n=1 Tax=Styela clava TaxID=7725 RepID=UPI00193A205F|nr:uncharacterized protein LOC120331133 [Styela clava]
MGKPTAQNNNNSNNTKRHNTGKQILGILRKRVMKKKKSTSSLLSKTFDKFRKSELREKLPEYYIGPSTSVCSSTTKTWTSYLDDDKEESYDEEDNNQNIGMKLENKKQIELAKEIEMKEKLLEIERERLAIAKKLIRAEKHIHGINKHTSL